MARPKLVRPRIYVTGDERVETLIHKTIVALEKRELHEEAFLLAARFAQLQEGWKPVVLDLVRDYVDIRENSHDTC